MCGIAGQLLLAREAVPRPERVEAMCAALRHRGPDAGGLWRGARAVLGHRRLSIIDLAGGAQPMGLADGRVQVVFNGEIYEHKALRRELEAGGARFRTRSDTEVLLHGWRAWGSGLCERLDGMFAFALVDEARGEALLARDRAGKKPLYWLEHEGSLWFASELGALETLPGWSRALDAGALDAYFSEQFVEAPRTVFRAVHQLAPGHLLRVRDGQVTLERWHEPRFAPKLAGDERELGEELVRLTRAAVARRLESEVPLGAFLSGGVDSSIVVALMAEELSAKVRTFTIGFEEKAWDEREHARRVAERFGSEHHELVVRPKLGEELQRVLSAWDEPFADPSAVPSWYVAREARREITVVLTGDGADDVLAGYGRYATSALERAFARLPFALRAPLERAGLAALGGRSAPAVAARPLGKALAKRLVPHLRSLVIPAYLSGWDKRRLYRPEFARRVDDEGEGAGGLEPQLVALWKRSARWPEPLDRMLAADRERYLPGDLLVKLDRATMAHSLEARSPFLDRELVGFADRLPDRVRVRDGHGKWLLKQAFAARLPEGIAWRKKQGFGVPIERWLRAELGDMARELLVESPRLTAAVVETRGVARLLAEHQAGRKNHAGRLWALLCLELWGRRRAGRA